MEAGLLAAHVLAYLAVVFTVLSPLPGLVFVAVHQGLWGVYMGCSVAPNHKGMPTLPPGHRLDYLRKQVLTTRNVYGRRWVDFVLGGLNYQIEHHLFPSMPRPNLRRAQALVQSFCESHGIDYVQCGLSPVGCDRAELPAPLAVLAVRWRDPVIGATMLRRRTPWWAPSASIEASAEAAQQPS